MRRYFDYRNTHQRIDTNWRRSSIVSYVTLCPQEKTLETMRLPKALSCCPSYQPKPSHHVPKGSRWSKLLVCHQWTQCPRLRHANILDSSRTRRAGANPGADPGTNALVFVCPSRATWYLSSLHQLRRRPLQMLLGIVVRDHDTVKSAISLALWR